MAGELWREVAQIGVEVTAGTPVAATRKIYLSDITFGRTREFRPFRPAVGSRANVRGATQGPVVAGGGGRLPVHSGEAIEWFLLGLQGGVTPSTPMGATAARLWTFTPGGTTLDSATIERNNGAGLQQLAGVRVNSLTFAGNVREDSSIRMELFATARDDAFGALTGSIADRDVSAYMEGWQTNLYLDAFGGTAGTTNITDMLIAWEVVIGNNLRRKYTARNNIAAQRLNIGVLDVTASLTLDAAAATYATELANWDALTRRLLRLEFLGPANGIETGFRNYVTVDVAGAWANPDTDQADEDSRAGRFPLQYIYDPTNAFAVKVRAQNNRTAAW